jgi:uncharacterized membrane protein
LANEPGLGSRIIAGIHTELDSNGQVIPVAIYVDRTYSPPRLLVHSLSTSNGGLPGIYTEKMEYDGNYLLIYHGFASPGTATSAAAWSIVKYTYTGTQITDKKWAGGSTAFSQIWDNRASLSYS